MERQDLSSSSSVVSDMLAEAPWSIPEAVLAAVLAATELKVCACDAASEFPRARLVGLEIIIMGPYRPGGDETMMEEFPDPALERSLEPVKLLRGGSACSIWLKNFVAKGNKKVVRTRCSHLFHRECLLLWLHAHNSCPFCRREVVV